MIYRKCASVLAVMALSLGVMLGAVAPACANDYVIYVASKDTPAATAAEGKANGTSILVERTLQRAFDKAGELLTQPGTHTANILVAGGDYAGKAGAGMWMVPQIKNAQATLRVIGGYGDDFTTRQPFNNLTRLTTNEGRNQGILNISKQSQLKELVISGLLFDAAPSNKYDERTNSILKGASRTVPLLTLGMLMTDHVVIADNIFINGAHGALARMVLSILTSCRCRPIRSWTSPTTSSSTPSKRFKSAPASATKTTR